MITARTIVTIALCLTASFVRGEKSLAQRIDALVEAKAVGIEVQPAADDAEFVRRLYLDFAGRIPTSTETVAFLEDNTASKREILIERLLQQPEYARQMAEVFHIMLMERRGDHEEWTAFLRHAFAENLPWDEIARAVIKPDAENEKQRGAAYFMSARLVKEGAMAAVDIPALTRDVGRMFAGVDLKCAQCHDDISIEDYAQQKFQGLHMVFENIETRRDTKFPAISEKLMTDKKEFMSVFIQEPKQTGPFIPGGGEVEIVTFEKDAEYLVPPDKKKKIPGVPKFSPLDELATRLTTKENHLFAKNGANRLWFIMMGRGLVEPLDLHHSDNPASHPELLELLTTEFAAHDFDIRWMLRELALTKTYQRTSLLSEEEAPPENSFTSAVQRRISAEQLFRNVLIATGEPVTISESWTPTVENFDSLLKENESLKDLQKLFIKTFANSPKDPEVEFAPTVEGALFLMHSEQVLQLLQPKSGNLVDRLSKLENSDAIADKLFLATLSRHPSDQDRQDVTTFLKDNIDDKPQAISQLAWALLASTEFCVNH